MKSLSPFILLLFLMPLVSSEASAQFYYISEIGNLTALSKQHDLKIAGSLGSALERGRHYNIQAGYSPFPNIGIQASYFNAIFNEVFDQDPSSGNSKTIAIGTYRFHDFKKTSQHTKKYPRFKLRKGILMDAYLGYTKGNVINHYNQVNSSDLNYRKVFFQGGASLQDGMIGLQTTLKFGFIDFIDGDYNGSNFNIPDQSLLFLERQSAYNFIESSIVMNMGIRHGKFYAAQSFVRILGENNLPKIKNAFQFGFILSINEFFIRKNPSLSET